MASPPTLKFVASTVCLRVLLEENGADNNVTASNPTYLTRLFETGCFTAVSTEILDRIVKCQPENLTSRLLRALVPSHVRELSLEGCVNVQLCTGLVRVLKKCSQIHKLNLTQCTQLIHPDVFTFIGLANIPLTTLILEGNNNVTDDVVHSALKNARNLSTLDVSMCPNISNNVFLLDEDIQLVREVSTNKLEDTFNCNLTSIAISGCRQLDSTAVKHITSLCGPKLKCIDISYTSCDCSALIYLAGYSLPTFLDFILNNEDLQSDKDLQLFLKNYQEIRDVFVEKCRTSVVSDMKINLGDNEANHVECISEKKFEIKSDSVKETANFPEYIPESSDVLEDELESEVKVCDTDESNSSDVLKDELESEVKVCDTDESNSSDVLKDELESEVKVCGTDESNSSDVLKDVLESEVKVCDIDESKQNGQEVRSECTWEDTVEASSADWDYLNISKPLLVTDEMVKDYEDNQNETENLCDSSKSCTNTAGDQLVENTLCNRDQDMNADSNVGVNVGLKDASLSNEYLLVDDGDGDEEIEESLKFKSFKTEYMTGEKLVDTTANEETTSHIMPQSNKITTSVNAVVSDKIKAHCDNDESDSKKYFDKYDIDNVKKVCDKHETHLYNSRILSLNVLGMKFVGGFKFGQICLEKFLDMNPCLQKLSLSWKGLTPEYFEKIVSKLQDLRDVQLEECTMLQNEGVASLGENCPKCLSVNLRGVVFISDSGLVPFLANKNLQCFNLAESTSITDKIVTLISEKMNQSLISLDLSYCEEVTEAGINSICSNCPSLKKLLLHKCPVSDFSLKVLAETCKDMVELSIQGVNPNHEERLSDEGILSLANNFRYLRMVDISWNYHLTDLSVCAIMKNCCELEEAIMEGLKQITVLPFLPIISGHTEDNCEVADNTSPLPYRSTVYARNLHILDLDFSDFVNDKTLQRIVNVCRGTLLVTDYYGQNLVPETS